jgi:aldehyde:ferredoxin oxidoreductase
LGTTADKPSLKRVPPKGNRLLPESKKVITKAQMTELLKEYYVVRGWNPKGEPPDYAD